MSAQKKVTKKAVNDTKTTEKPTKQKWSSKKKIVVYVIAAIAALIIILVISINAATGAPAKVSDEFMNNILDNRATAAYDLMASEAQNQTSSQDFSSAADRMSSILTGELKTTGKEISAETGSDPSATVEYEIKGNDNYTYKITVNLVQQDGEWKVLNMNSEKQ